MSKRMDPCDHSRDSMDAPRLADELGRADSLQPDADFSETSRAAFMQAASARIRRSRLASPKMRLILITGILTVAMGGTAIASQASLQGLLLYPVKRAAEHVQLLTPTDDGRKAEVKQDVSEKRPKVNGSMGRTEGAPSAGPAMKAAQDVEEPSTSRPLPAANGQPPVHTVTTVVATKTDPPATAKAKDKKSIKHGQEKRAKPETGKSGNGRGKMGDDADRSTKVKGDKLADPASPSAEKKAPTSGSSKKKSK